MTASTKIAPSHPPHTLSPSRHYHIDNIRALMSFFIVLLHTIDLLSINLRNLEYNPGIESFSLDNMMFLASVCLFLNGCAMPMFFFLSGHLSKSAVINRSLTARRVGSLVAIMLTVIAITNLVERWFGIAGTNHLWYLYSLAIVTVLLHLCKAINPKLLFAIAIVLGVFIEFLFWNNDGLLGSFSRLSIWKAIYSLPYFLAGLYFKKEWLQKIANSAFRWISPFVFVGIFFGVLWCFRQMAIEKNEFSIEQVQTTISYFLYMVWVKNASYSFASILPRLLQYVIVALLGLCVVAFMPQKKVPLLTTLGERALPIYLYHIPILVVISRFLKDYPPITSLPILVAIALAITIFLAWKPFGIPFELITKCVKRVIKYKEPRKATVLDKKFKR
ncbi:MAG: acyltransferase [Oscillospiraceae bacterium]|nr:acyltransferase [Oscillospiraceae bacterium]